MPYLNFNKVAPAAPNDPLLDEAIHLNQNWDHLDDKMQPYIHGGSISGIDTGQEYFSSGFRYAVWAGTESRQSDDIDAAWSAWTTFTPFAGRAARTNFAPKWRSNSLLRVVECSGGFLFGAGGTPWTTGSAFALNADTSASPPASMAPVGGKSVSTVATGLTAGTNVVSGGIVTVDKPGGNTFVRLMGQYMGGDGGGNFLMIDQLWWWY